jgi:hypothetical protein
MWALGVPRSVTESIYRAVDACVLDTALEQLERSAVRDTAALQALQRLTRDSVHLEKGVLTPDRTLRSMPGSTYSPQCSARVAEDRAGFTVGTSVLAQPPSSNLFARDLHARDTALVQQFPARPLYLLRPTSSELGAPLVLEPLRLDSVAVSWGTSPSALTALVDTSAVLR